jgi:hypothetical protein
MIRGQLSEMQRDKAWEGKDLAERKAMTAHDLTEPTPEQQALKDRSDREKVLDENFGRGEIAQDVGKIATGAGASRKNEVRINEDRKKERQAQTDRQLLLQMLDNRIAALDHQIEWYDEQIAEANEALTAIDELERLHQAGELDPSNPAHADLCRRAGIDPDDLETDSANVFARSREAWTTRRGDLEAGRDDARRSRDGLIDRRNRIAQAETPEEIADLENMASELAADGQLIDANDISISLVETHGNTEAFRDYLIRAGRDEVEQADIIAATQDQDIYTDEYSGGYLNEAAPAYLSFADQIDPEGAANAGDEAQEIERIEGEPHRDVLHTVPESPAP